MNAVSAVGRVAECAERVVQVNYAQRNATHGGRVHGDAVQRSEGQGWRRMQARAREANAMPVQLSAIQRTAEVWRSTMPTTAAKRGTPHRALVQRTTAQHSRLLNSISQYTLAHSIARYISSACCPCSSRNGLLYIYICATIEFRLPCRHYASSTKHCLPIPKGLTYNTPTTLTEPNRTPPSSPSLIPCTYALHLAASPPFSRHASP